jgi:hypothetical protein
MAEAKLNREYALRVVAVGAMMVCICAWSIYDGTAGWPGKNRALEAVRPALLATNLTAEAWLARDEDDGPSRLAAAFQAQGLAVPSKLIKKVGELKLPDKDANNPQAREVQAERQRALLKGPVYSAHDLQSQFVMAALTLGFGLLAFGSVFAKSKRRFVADEAGLSGSGFGGRFGYDDLAGIDWSKWNEKDIVTLLFKSGRRVKLDGWHFAGMTAIVDELQSRRPDLAERREAQK